MERGHAWLLARGRLVRSLLAEGLALPSAVDGRAIAEDALGAPVVLDAGAGTGAFAASLAADGMRVVAVDAVLPEIESPGVERVSADVGSLPFADATFDAALSLDVLEHLPDDRAGLTELARVLKPGAPLVVNVPADQSLWSPHDELAGHLRRYERAGLVEAVTASGLEVVRVGYWAATTLPLLRFSRALARRSATALRAEQRPPAPVDALLRPLLAWDVEHALGRGWNSGSSLFALARRRS